MARVLIANRGEIAVRIARALSDLGWTSAAVYAADEGDALHPRRADLAAALPGRGAAAYLDVGALLQAAADLGCEMVHPGYGFLSESPEFARACAAADLIFVGPSPQTLELFADKARARAFAASCEVRIAEGLEPGASLSEAEAFLASRPEGGEVMIKALAGGGGRGMRRLAKGADLASALEAASREAAAAFGDGGVFLEDLVREARHIEVQILADGAFALAVGDRDCSVQRRRQKLVEIAPAPALPHGVRQALQAASVRMAEQAGLRGLATFEFLVPRADPGRAVFIECNPRLQVEHTVTEEAFGVDLVQAQLRIAAGEPLAALGVQRPVAQRRAVQFRINLETLTADGALRSGAGGRIDRYEPPSGPGVRVDGCGYAGLRTHPGFDSLIAKLIVFGEGPELAARAARALREFVLKGPRHNICLLRALLERPELLQGGADTEFLERELPGLTARAQALEAEASSGEAEGAPAEADLAARDATGAAPGARDLEVGEGGLLILAPLSGTLISVRAEVGGRVRAGEPLAALEAMKMHHLVEAPSGGVLVEILAGVGDVVEEGAPLFLYQPLEDVVFARAEETTDPDEIRPDLAALQARLALTRDASRPEAVARRRRTGQRTARENLADLFDEGRYEEFGALTLAAQRRRRDLEDLRRSTPADGIITALGAVNGEAFGPEVSRCVGLAYDYTVLAGTQGHFGHKKTDRILEFAERWELPIVWFTEGGGGRPGDVDVGALAASSLDTTSFTAFARLSGSAPRIAINSGRCFAGNAVFFGCADITIATRNSNIGLGGPAMIEGGGLGVFRPEDIGPAAVQYANGVLDLLVETEAEATSAARRLLSVFQGAVKDWTCPDQRRLRRLVPENRLLAYDVRPVVETLADAGSFLELLGGYGPGMITGFLRIEGRPLGLIANDPRRLGGAIDGEGAEKGARFLQLCDAFKIPVLSLCDTPGFMVGPKSEASGSVRRGSRLFVTAASLRVPLFAVVLRKGYGLGAQAMTGGDFSASAMTLAWPTAEFGPMGLEGAVRLGFKRELEGEADPDRRRALYDKLLARMYETGKAVSVAEVDEIDAVIDPAETRAWIVRGLKACVPGASRRRFVDVW